MKKILSVIAALSAAALMCPAQAAYTQYDIYSSINHAFMWMEETEPPLKTSDSSAADYCIMALSEMNKSYAYDKYVTYTESRNPSTDNDGQRLIMATTACGSVMHDKFVKLYTYGKLPDNAADLAGAIITLDCGGYEVKSDTVSKEYMVMSLLAMQQDNGSFSGDVYTTAKSVIALAPYSDMAYKINDDFSEQTYSVETALLNAVQYLQNTKKSDYGFGTVTNTAFAIMALDSIGIDADNDAAFSKNGKSPVTQLISKQQDNGSFNNSADDTALALCALVSHLRAMQGKTRFFDFSGRNKLDPVTENAAENRSGAGFTESKPSSDTTKQAVIALTPPPTAQPEHSAVSEEIYGPLPPVGPVRVTDKPTERPTEEAFSDDGTPHLLPIIIAIVLLLLFIAGAALLLVYDMKYPDKAKALLDKLKEILHPRR